MAPDRDRFRLRDLEFLTLFGGREPRPGHPDHRLVGLLRITVLTHVVAPFRLVKI
jgi:hypothetical protein